MKGSINHHHLPDLIQQFMNYIQIKIQVYLVFETLILDLRSFVDNNVNCKCQIASSLANDHLHHLQFEGSSMVVQMYLFPSHAVKIYYILLEFLSNFEDCLYMYPLFALPYHFLMFILTFYLPHQRLLVVSISL